MLFKNKSPLLMLMITILLVGCAGSRLSYQSLLDETTIPHTIYMSVGEKKEVLAVGNGFPGWWGFHPSMLTQSPRIASVDCRQKRGFIPFREPGVVFGGYVCCLTAHKTGETLAQYGNAITLRRDITETKLTDYGRWIKIVVTAP